MNVVMIVEELKGGLVALAGFLRKALPIVFKILLIAVLIGAIIFGLYFFANILLSSVAGGGAMWG